MPLIFQRKNDFLFLKKAIFLILLLLLIGFAPDFSALKAQSAPCQGNLCQIKEIPFYDLENGGIANKLNISYTYEVKPGEEFRIRFFNQREISPTSSVMFSLIDFPYFASGPEIKIISSGSVNPHDANVTSSYFSGSITTTQSVIKVERENFSGWLDFVLDIKLKKEDLEAGAKKSFKIGVIEYGQLYLSGELTFVVSDKFSNETENEDQNFCSDSLDNDLDYQTDCLDPDCAGQVGNSFSRALCERQEETCYDNFDNDADGKVDCQDENCNDKAANKDGTIFCYQPEGATSSACQDFFDNDGNGLKDCFDPSCQINFPDLCPSRETMETCNNGVDDDHDDGLNTKDDKDDRSSSLTGRDCLDYDCASSGFCPNSESGAACFDGLDNDLDAYVWNGSQYVPSTTPSGKLSIDCGDPDCKGAINPNPPYQSCQENEFEAFKYNFCANPKGYLATLKDKDGFDDNGDGQVNCRDKSCFQKFGNCGPCPSQEFIAFDACADNLDNDFDEGADCQDPDCNGKIGNLNGLALCEYNKESSCSDNFDNDADGLVDCQDPDCNGKDKCEFGEETTCNDGFDNDADGWPDCLDSNCFGKDSCAGFFATSSCLALPSLPYWEPSQEKPETLAPGGEIYVAQTKLLYTSTPFQVKFWTDKAYSSVTITLGHAFLETKKFPYEIGNNCELDGPDKAKFSLITNPRVVQIQSITSLDNGFDITLKCSLENVDLTKPFQTYSLALDALRKENGIEIPEIGERIFSVKAFENIPPEIRKIEVVGLQNKEVKIPFGGSLFLRAIPYENNSLGDQSGICGCDFLITDELSEDGNSCGQNSTICFKPFSSDCRFELPNLTKDVDTLYIKAKATDGSGNTSTKYGPENFSIKLNVLPIAKPGNQVKLNKIKPFYEPGELISFSNGNFWLPPQEEKDNSKITVKALIQKKENENWSDETEPENISINSGIKNDSNMTTVFASGNFQAPSSDGEYRLTLKLTDASGDSAQTLPVVFYVCSENDNSSPCDKADFDQDGFPERTFVNENLYGIRLPCDNCPEVFNPDQEDKNGNGVGDACEGQILDEKVCLNNLWVSCTSSNDCPNSGKCCTNGLGICQNTGKWCCEDKDCTDEKGATSTCQKTPPWVETQKSDVYGMSIGVPEDVQAPPNKFNATFCLLSSGEIANWSSEKGCSEKGISQPLKFLKSLQKIFFFTKNQKTPLSFINLEKLENQASKLPVQEEGGKQKCFLDSSQLTNLNKSIYLCPGDLYLNSSSTVSGQGLIIVQGNLYLKGDISYNLTSDPKSSLGFLVLDNIYIDRNVKNLVGTYFSLGEIQTGSSPEFLEIQGLLVGKKIIFQRQRAKKEQGSERIIYDGRVHLYPPPGLEDFLKELPVIRQTLP